MRILIMGLPGSGKTTLSNSLKEKFNCIHLNADQIRKDYDDWDFSYDGRKRQLDRMNTLSNHSLSNHILMDFVCPLEEFRDTLAADFVIWMNTIQKSRFEDTNVIFEQPKKYDIEISNFDYNLDEIIEKISSKTKKVFDFRKPTVQMLGRWQPWHEGHRALFERALAKTGQVCIMVRDCQNWNNSNPFDFEFVKNRIEENLKEFEGSFIIMLVPNIVNITYGRSVGYVIEQEIFTDEIHNISATKIRNEMGLK